MAIENTTVPAPSKVVANFSVSAEYTAQQTDTVVQAAPGVGFRNVITSLYLVVNAAVDITIEQGTTVIKWKFYGDAKSAGVAESQLRIEFAENTTITITTSGAVSVSVMVGGVVEKMD